MYGIITPFLPPRTFEKHGTFRTSYRDSLALAENDRVTVVRSGIGAEAVENACAFLKDRSCEALFFIGSCGGITDAAIGEILLVREAYAPDRSRYSFPDRALHARVEASLARSGIAARQGSVFSVASLDAEDEELLRRLQERKVHGIDMELYHLYSCARELRIPAVGVVYVTDEPFAKPFTARHSPADREKIVAARDTVIAAVLRCIGEMA